MKLEEVKKHVRYTDGKLYKFDMGIWCEIKGYYNKGYLRTSISGKNIYLHTLIYMLYYSIDIPTTMQIDHINGVRDDNRIENLRLVTPRQNSGNLKIHRDRGGVGFTRVTKTGVYVASIIINNESVYLGSYLEAEDASYVYEKACQYLYLYESKPQFCAFLSRKLGFTVGKRHKTKGYRKVCSRKRNGACRYIVYLHKNNKEIYIKTFRNETMAKELACLVQKYKPQYENKTQFLELLRKDTSLV